MPIARLIFSGPKATTEQLEFARKGIEAYRHEQKVLLRILRRHGRLHQDRFDRIFSAWPRRRAYFLVALSGDTLILGYPHVGDWVRWLELLQIMVLLGDVDQDGTLPNVHYFLPTRS